MFLCLDYTPLIKMVKNKNIALAFVLFVTVALGFMWFYASPNTNQIDGALKGVPGTDLISPLMATLLILWFLLLVSVIYVTKHSK